MKLGDKLRKWRKRNGLTMRAAGIKIGIAAATVLRIERGSDPRFSIAGKIERAIR